METNIKWSITEVRKISFEKFHKLCKGQYKNYYKNVKKSDIEKEYEFLTGKQPIKK